jgi:O-antigen/teichoic acid export membrane protein
MIGARDWDNTITIRQRLGQLFGATNRLIISNTSAMMGTMLITSGLGALYWLLGARFFDTEAVGLAGASISSMSLLGTAGMLGLGTLLIGELPRQRGQEISFIATALLIAGLTGGLCGGLFALIAPRVSPNLQPFAADMPTAAIFILGVSVTSVTMVLDQALIGLLRGSLQLWRNAAFAVIKLGALVGIAVWLGGENWRTMYATWIIGNLLSLLGLGGFIVWRWPGLQGRQLWPQWHLLRRFGRTALGHHALNMALQLPGLALPLVVTSLLSATANAYYYAASIAAGPFFFGTLALVTALYAVGSRSPEALTQRIRFTLGVAFGAAVAGNLVLLFTAELIMRLFGSGYAAEAGLTLKLLGLCIFPIIIKDHYVTLSRIHGRLMGTAVLATAGGGAELGLAALGAITYGLSGLVLGWLAALTIESLIMLPKVYRAARGEGLSGLDNAQPIMPLMAEANSFAPATQSDEGR